MAMSYPWGPIHETFACIHKDSAITVPICDTHFLNTVEQASLGSASD